MSGEKAISISREPEMTVLKLYYYHPSEAAFLCLFREIVCCFPSHAFEISYSGWKMISSVPSEQISGGVIFKGQHLPYPFQSIPDSCCGDGLLLGVMERHMATMAFNITSSTETASLRRDDLFFPLPLPCQNIVIDFALL